MTDSFKDTSIFNGIIQFTDDDDVEYRFERNGGKIWKVFESDENGNFICQGIITTKIKTNSCRYLYKAFIKHQMWA